MIYGKNTLDATLREIEDKYSPDCFAGMIAGAYALWLGREKNEVDIEDLPAFLKKAEKDEDIRFFVQNAMSDHWDKYRPYITTFDKELLRQEILEAVPRDSRAGFIAHTPEGILELVTRILEISPDDHVADFGSGIGEFLCYACRRVPQAHYWGNDIATQVIAISKIRAKMLGGNISLVQENMFQPGKDGKVEFDKAFCFPPWGMRLNRMPLTEKFMMTLPASLPRLKGTVSGEWIFALKMLSQLKKGGRAVLAMPPGGLFSIPDNDVRRYLLERQKIEAVILLPSRLLDSTGISLALVVFSDDNQKVRMIDASELGEHKRRNTVLTSEDVARIMEALKGGACAWSTEIDSRDVIEKGNMDPGYHTKNDIKLNYRTDLGGVIKEVLRGAQLSAAELEALTSAEPTDCQYLALSSIKHGIIDDDLPYLSSIDERLRRYCLQKNDIILSKIGSPFKVAVAAPSERQNILGNGNLFIIRVDESIADPYYIKIFLESELGQSLLMRNAAGAAMPNLSIESIKKLPISLPPLARQQELAQRYLAKADEVALLRRKLDAALDALGHVLDFDNPARS